MGDNVLSYHVYETRRHKRAPMSGNSKHSKNNFKIYVIIFVNFFNVRDGRTILFSFMSVNKSSYIYLIILLID